MFGIELSTRDTAMYLVMKWIDHLISIACGKHQPSLYDDDVEIRVMHPTLSSNKMIVGIPHTSLTQVDLDNHVAMLK